MTNNNNYQNKSLMPQLPELPHPPANDNVEYNPFTDESSPFFGLSPDWRPNNRRPIPTLACYYTLKNGNPCKNRAVRGTGITIGSKPMCKNHGGGLPNVAKHAEAVVQAARLQITDSAPDAIRTIMELMNNGQTADNVRLKAATEILDRMGIKGGIEVEIEVTDHREKPSDKLRKKLESMRNKSDDTMEEEIIDAEPLEDLGESESAEENS